MSKRILHLLQWKLTDIMKEIPKIKEQGFDSIQISPLQGTKDNGDAWWLLYQPTNFKIGNPQVGSREELIELCNLAHEHFLEVYVDVVLRHVAGNNKGELIPHESVDPAILPEYYYCDIPLVDEDSRYDYTHYCTGMPMLDYWNHGVQDLMIEYLDDLVLCGVDGFRLDQLKHYCVPEEGCDFLTRVFGRYSDEYIYGEIIFTDTTTLDLYTPYMKVLTDGTASDKDKMLTFIESHDTYHTFGYTKGISSDLMVGEWDILINKAEFNGIFFARPWDDTWKRNEIRYANLLNKVTL